MQLYDARFCLLSGDEENNQISINEASSDPEFEILGVENQVLSPPPLPQTQEKTNNLLAQATTNMTYVLMFI